MNNPQPNIYVCQHCKNNIEFSEDAAGTEITCPGCDCKVMLPEIGNAKPTPLHERIRKNTMVCPKCKEFTVEYDRESVGTEVTCTKCDHVIRIPEFIDDPTVVLEHIEKQFLDREEDDSFNGGSDYHEGDPAISVSHGWGLAGLLGIIVALLTAFGISVLPDRMMNAGTRNMVIQVALSIFTIIVVAAIIRSIWYSHKTNQLGTLRFVSPDKKQRLEMGENLQGRITLKLNKPLERCSLGLSLVLLHGTKVSSGDSTSIHYRALSRSSALLFRDKNFESDSEEVFEFTIPTPKHEPEEVDVPGFFSFLKNGPSKNYLKAKQLPWQALRDKRKKHRLKWELTAELVGPLGIALQRQTSLIIA